MKASRNALVAKALELLEQDEVTKEKQANIETLKIHIKKLNADHQQRRDESNDEIVRLKRQLVDLSSPKPSATTGKTDKSEFDVTNIQLSEEVASLMDHLTRINQNLLEAQIHLHILNTKIHIRDNNFLEAHDSASQAEDFLNEFPLNTGLLFARVLYWKARVDYGKKDFKQAVAGFEKAQAAGLTRGCREAEGDDVQEWLDNAVGML